MAGAEHRDADRRLTVEPNRKRRQLLAPSSDLYVAEIGDFTVLAGPARCRELLRFAGPPCVNVIELEVEPRLRRRDLPAATVLFMGRGYVARGQVGDAACRMSQTHAVVLLPEQEHHALDADRVLQRDRREVAHVELVELRHIRASGDI